MTQEDITIAVTVFNRRQYIEQAVNSAVEQTLPVRVIAVEDCGPDPTLQSLVVARFGSRITYHRNSRRRGLFDNWNACLELCQTPWLCLLHDDDFLAPDFVAAMLELAAKIPGQGLYHGRCHIIDSAGNVAWTTAAVPGAMWQTTDAVEAALRNPVCFPADLFRADYVRALGGFRPTSLFTGDWDMWAKLALHYGAARTNRVIGYYRSHETEGRGTMRVVRNGKCHGLTLMQARKNVALARQHGKEACFDRRLLLQVHPVPTRFMLENAWGLSRRMLAYNYRLLLESRPPHRGHSFFQRLARWFGPGFVRAASKSYQVLRKLGSRR